MTRDEMIQWTQGLAALWGMTNNSTVEKTYRAVAAQLRSDGEEIARLRAALRRLVAWSSPFIENTPITAETLWREFPAAIKNARAILAQTKDPAHG